MRIVLTGSGTGGHFYPLIAIVEALNASTKEQQAVAPELYLLGPNPYDRDLLLQQHINYIHIPAGKMRRYFSLKNGTDFIATIVGIFVAIWKLYVLYPDVVMSKGSYTSVPVVIAAIFLRIPIILHESDVRPGRANKLVARFAHIITTSYEDSAPYFPTGKTPEKLVRTGIPIRSHLLNRAPADPYTHLGISADRPLILILGGSQGAERINDLIVTSLDTLLGTYTVIHQTGSANVQVVSETARAVLKHAEYIDHYHVRGFLDVDTLSAALTAATLVVSRAGSGSIYEIALYGKASILIPIPEEISHDQRLNAYTYARTGAAVVIEERNLTTHLLTNEINRIIGDHAQRERMEASARAFAPTDAAQRIAQLLLDICVTHEY